MPDLFNAPIPGESLTREPGNAPWEQPPQFASVEEAYNYYMEKFEDDEFEEDLSFLLEQGMSIEEIVDGMTKFNVMYGRHTLDVAMLLSPLIHEYIASVADVIDVPYKEWKGEDSISRRREKNKEYFNTDYTPTQRKFEDEISPLEEQTDSMLSEQSEPVQLELFNEEPKGFIQRRG